MVIVEPQKKKMKLDHSNSTNESQEQEQYVIDVYKEDQTVEEDYLETHPSVLVTFLNNVINYTVNMDIYDYFRYFMESYGEIDFGSGRPEYDSDYDSQDSNDENYYGNSYPEESSSYEEDFSSDASDRAYFSDYDSYDYF